MGSAYRPRRGNPTKTAGPQGTDLAPVERSAYLPGMAQPRITEQVLNEPVTSHCHRDFTTLRPEWTVTESLAHMRANPPPGRIIYFYVVDADGKLVGVVPTRRLLLNPPDKTIADLMIRQVIVVPESATVLDACEFFTFHKLLAFPIVDAARRLVGVIDIDLYTEELAWNPDEPMTPGAADDVFEIIGVHLSAAQQADPVASARGRFPWLLCNIAGGLLAAVLSGVYQDVLTWRDAVLALFIPVVLALSESVSIQSVTLTVSRLRTETPRWDVLARHGLVEGTAGLLLGAGCALVVAGVAGVWLQDLTVVVVLLLGIGCGVTASAVIGFSVPTVLHRVRWNPQVAAGPVALALADMVTLLAYFNLARALG